MTVKEAFKELEDMDTLEEKIQFLEGDSRVTVGDRLERLKGQREE